MISVLDRQSIFDISLQYFGSAESALEIAIANGMILTDLLPSEIKEVSVVNQKVTDYYAINRITPATEVTGELNFEYTTNKNENSILRSAA